MTVQIDVDDAWAGGAYTYSTTRDVMPPLHPDRSRVEWTRGVLPFVGAAWGTTWGGLDLSYHDTTDTTLGAVDAPDVQRYGLHVLTIMPATPPTAPTYLRVRVRATAGGRQCVAALCVRERVGVG